MPRPPRFFVLVPLLVFTSCASAPPARPSGLAGDVSDSTAPGSALPPSGPPPTAMVAAPDPSAVAAAPEPPGVPTRPASPASGEAGAAACRPSSPWTRVDVGEFSFEAPCDLRTVPVQGIDSKVGQHQSDTMTLTFDYGRYSSSLEELRGAPSYRAEQVQIDAKPAKIVTASSKDDPKQPFVAAVHFPNIASGVLGTIKLTVFVRGATSADQKAATKIFRSIRFARR